MNTVKRTYLLGEEWLYYKIYCGVRTADAILTNEVSELTRQLLTNDLIDKWFFIRYRDSEDHLRLRFKLTNTDKLNKVINYFNGFFKPLLKKELVWNIQTETYSREIERYGPSTMELSESIFFEQSEILIKLLQEDLDDEIYFIKIMGLVKHFIESFELEKNRAASFLNDWTNIFINEFELNKNAKIDIDKKYRKLKPLFEKEFIEDFTFKVYHRELDKLIRVLTKIEKKDQLEVPLQGFISSHTHMLINRAFRDRQRFYELLIFTFLSKFYGSIIPQ